jgi:hypothetical protein
MMRDAFLARDQETLLELAGSAEATERGPASILSLSAALTALDQTAANFALVAEAADRKASR